MARSAWPYLVSLPFLWLGCVQILGADADYRLGDIAGGGAGQGGSGSSGSTGGTGGTGGVGGAACGVSPAPMGGECPAICNEGCDDDTCVIDCASGCDNTITCPPGFDCEIRCGANDCRNTDILCPDTYRCDLRCSMMNACEDAVLNCTDGPCSVACMGSGCDDVTVACGSNACTVMPCANNNNPTLDCGDACECTGCD